MIEFIKKHFTLILRLLIILVLLWLSIGYFPIMSYEGDSALVSAGCERLYANGLKLPPDYFYQWNMQPLTGLLVVGVKHILFQFTCEQIYYALTVMCSVLFLFVSPFFVSKLIKTRWEYIFFILLLFPESYAIGSYANTAIFALLFFLLGLLFILKRTFNFYSTVLLGIAPLFRVDILVIYPVILFLIWNNNTFKKSLYYTSLYAFFILTISIFGFWLLKANPLETLSNFNLVMSGNSATSNIFFEKYFKVNSTFYPVAVLVMIILGIYNLYKKKEFKLLIISLLSTITLNIIYRNGFASLKHISYEIPFLSIILVYSVSLIKRQLIEKKYFLFVSIIILLFMQFFIGIRFYPISKPWTSTPYSQQYSRPSIAKIFSYSIKSLGGFEIVLGAGSVIPTYDENVLISGYFFAPFYWNSIKQQDICERKVLENIISEVGDSIQFITLVSDWPLSMYLHSIGFKIRDLHESNSQYDYCFIRGNQNIFEKNIDVDRSPESFNAAFHSIENRPTYVMSIWDWQRYLINERKTEAEPVSKSYSIIK